VAESTRTPSGGLRDRKKQAAMRRIQEVALDLFDARGFNNVSIDEIAAAAEVSPSSVYRYFGTKEQVVLYDEVDFQLIERLDTELASHPPVDAVRRAMSDLLSEFFARDDDLTRRKVRYAYEEPALRAATFEMTESFTPLIADALARALDLEPDQLEVQVVAATLVAALMAAVRHWYAGDFHPPLQKEIDRVLAVVESGLQLPPRHLHVGNDST
jgi:AcrR family transcriptional regulator